MPYRKQKFANEEIYHIVVRAIDDNVIFKDIDDHYRGIFSIYEFNNIKSVTIRERRRERLKIKKCRDRVSADSASFVDLRDKLVEVLVFCLMPNHFHLLVKQLKDDGIVKFMSKMGAGLGGYFNKKYNRKGHVFQNRFEAVHIKTEEQLKIVWAYIHANPVSLIEPKWKEKGIQNLDEVIKFLEEIYKWFSYQDYIGKKNFPSVIERDFLLEIIGGHNRCKEFLKDYLKYAGKIKEFSNLLLE